MSNPFALLDEDGVAPAAKAPAPKVEAAKPAAGKEGAFFEGPSFLRFMCTWQLTVSDSQPPAVCACLTCAPVTVSPLQPPSRPRAATQARRRLRPAAGVVVAAEARHAPGHATTPHHHAVTEEIYYILSGTAAMTLADETRAVGPGDAIAIPPGLRHTIRNTGTEELVFLCTCAPGYEHSDTFLAG
jgi:mannose-6-phosphate isomerase-like protein (cupin superfamily)